MLGEYELSRTCARHLSIESALLQTPGCDLNATTQAKFGENMADVRLSGLFGDHQLVGDLAVASSAGDELNDAALPFG